jgi:hypothetical protein
VLVCRGALERFSRQSVSHSYIIVPSCCLKQKCNRGGGERNKKNHVGLWSETAKLARASALSQPGIAGRVRSSKRSRKQKMMNVAIMGAIIACSTLICLVSWELYNILARSTWLRDDRFAPVFQQANLTNEQGHQTQGAEVLGLLPELLVRETTHDDTGGFTAIDSVCKTFPKGIRFHIVVRGNIQPYNPEFVYFTTEWSNSQLMADSADTHLFDGASTILLSFQYDRLSRLTDTLKQAEQDCADLVRKTNASVRVAVAAVVIVHPHRMDKTQFSPPELLHYYYLYPHLWQQMKTGQMIFVWHRAGVRLVAVAGVRAPTREFSIPLPSVTEQIENFTKRLAASKAQLTAELEEAVAEVLSDVVPQLRAELNHDADRIAE